MPWVREQSFLLSDFLSFHKSYFLLLSQYFLTILLYLLLIIMVASNKLELKAIE